MKGGISITLAPGVPKPRVFFERCMTLVNSGAFGTVEESPMSTNNDKIVAIKALEATD